MNNNDQVALFDILMTDLIGWNGESGLYQLNLIGG
jgi:hypothetical protein